MSSDTGILNEAYERFHTTGPEFSGALSNHGPMAVEAMVQHGHDRQVHAWIDWYQDRLEELPRGITPVTQADWREALGDATRLGDWTTFMLREAGERPWRELLVEWWPRLLPAITPAPLTVSSASVMPSAPCSPRRRQRLRSSSKVRASPSSPMPSRTGLPVGGRSTSRLRLKKAGARPRPLLP